MKRFHLYFPLQIEEIEELKEQYTNQRILFLTIKQFVKGDLFRNEYHNVTFYGNKDEILSLQSEKINPTQEINILVENITSALERIFISDHTPIYNDDNPKQYNFSGTRIHRGKYQRADGKVLNADVNGALNIL